MDLRFQLLHENRPYWTFPRVLRALGIPCSPEGPSGSQQPRCACERTDYDNSHFVTSPRTRARELDMNLEIIKKLWLKLRWGKLISKHVIKRTLKIVVDNIKPWFLVDGGLSDWGDWSACSPHCGEGTQTRTRTCTHPAPAHGGADCVGERTQTQSCNANDCPG